MAIVMTCPKCKNVLLNQDCKKCPRCHATIHPGALARREIADADFTDLGGGEAEEEQPSIRWACDGCDRIFIAERSDAGRAIKCPKCKTINVIEQIKTVRVAYGMRPIDVSIGIGQGFSIGIGLFLAALVLSPVWFVVWLFIHH